MQVAPLTPPSVWQTWLGCTFSTLHVTRKGVEVLGDSKTEKGFVIMDRRYCAQRAGSAGRLNLMADGYLPRLPESANAEAVTELLPFQIPPNAVRIQEGSTAYWTQAKKDPFSLLSIGR